MERTIKFLTLLLGLSLHLNLVWAQNTVAQKVAGEYMLQGVMETAAGFLINTDGTFEYGFTYGAADKSGKGTWKVIGYKLILNSNTPQPPADFILKSSTSKKTKGITIKITDANGGKYSYVKCRLSEVAGQDGTTDSQGEVHFESIGSGILELYHPIFSTRLTRINLNPKHNDFVIFPAYNLAEVFYKDFELQIGPDQLISITLPGMPPEDVGGQKKQYVFIKQR